MFSRAFLCSLSLLLLPVGFPLAGSSPKTVTAVRAEVAPVCDGQLDEPQWQAATAAMDFTQFDPVEGALPTELTSVRLLYDDHALYVGVICYDAKPEQIVKQLTRRDRSSEADRFTVLIDSYHDRKTALVFSTNVSGVQTDGILSQDGNVYDVTWDAVWSVSTRHFRDGWSAEFEIPYNALRFATREDGTYEWGINFRRYISRKKETDEWVMVPRKEMLQISRWGTMQGIRAITPPLHLELLPYVSTSGSYRSEGLNQGKSPAYDARVGMDLKYGLARNFTLNAALYPDFGQVEVDQAVLNLTVFETFFPEKRPFFVEGSQMFAFGTSIDNTSMPLFFSRRIGKVPSGAGYVLPPAGGALEENPLVTNILGAAKVTGRTNSGFSLGAISAATREENATVKDAAGVASNILTEPRGLYNAVRLKQDFGGTSWVGGMLTAVGHQTQLPALSGGVAWNLRFDAGGYTFDGYLAGARSSSNVTYRDGAASRLLFSRIAGEHWLYVVSGDFATRHYNPNDIGYFARPHDRGGYVQALYRENFAEGIFRRYSFSVVPEARWNWDGIRTFQGVEAIVSAEFKNFWRSTVDYRHGFPFYEDEERGIIGLRLLPASNYVQLSVTSDERKDVTATVTLAYEADQLQKRTFSGSMALTLRPVSWAELTPTLYYQRTRRDLAWVFPDGNLYPATGWDRPFSVFGDRDLDELDLGLRGIMTFTRSLSLQWFAQVLLARGQYNNYQRNGISTALTPYPDGTLFFRDHAFNEATLNANLLLRWEYMPGSTFYLVWTQARYGNNGIYDQQFGERFRNTFSLPMENVLLAKVSYLLPL